MHYENGSGSYNMNSDFDVLPYDTSFYQSNMYNYSSEDNDPFDYNRTDRDTMDFAYMTADTLRNGEGIMAICGVLLNVVFAGILICVMCTNRGKRAVMPRLWLVFGMIIAHIVYLVLLPFHSLLLNIAMMMSIKPLCMFISCIFESCDFASTFSTMILLCNVYYALHAPGNASSRKVTLVWIIAGFAAWVAGFGIGFATGAIAVEASEGHCGGFKPLTLEVIIFIVTFIAPYTVSFVLTGLTVYRWRKMGHKEVTQFQLSEGHGVGQVSKLPAPGITETSTTGTPSIVFTSSPSQENTENLGMMGAYKGAEPYNTSTNVPATSNAIESDITPVDGGFSTTDDRQLGKRSLKFWIIFNAVNVFVSFACRLCISLPIANLLVNWDWQVLYYMIIHMLLVLYYAVFPLLCLITVEVRSIQQNFRKCKVCYKICCWFCNCCLEMEGDDDE